MLPCCYLKFELESLHSIWCSGICPLAGLKQLSDLANSQQFSRYQFKSGNGHQKLSKAWTSDLLGALQAGQAKSTACCAPSDQPALGTIHADVLAKDVRACSGELLLTLHTR